MKLRRTAVLLALLLLAGTALRADDKKKNREKDVQDSIIENQDARAVMDRFTKKVKEEAWQDAFAAARELVEKHRDKLILVDETVTTDTGDGLKIHDLHGPAGWVLRRKLAALPPEAIDVFAKTFAEEAQHRLDVAKSAGELDALLDVGDLFFVLDPGAEALLAAGDIQLERGCIVGAAMAWRDVLELHGSAPLRSKAGKRLIALLPLLDDPATALDLAQFLKGARESFDGAADLEDAARKFVDDNPDWMPADCAVDGAGGLAPVFSAVVPGVGDKRIRLASDDVRTIDWRSQETTQNQWGQTVVPVRRLLSGNLATDEVLLVHLGKSIFAYYTDDDDSYEPPIETGQLAYAFGGHRGIKEYLNDVVTSSALARYGIALGERHRCFATLRAPSIDAARLLPRGKLVCFNVRSGAGSHGRKSYWDTQAFEASDEDDDTPRRKKKKKDDEQSDEKKEVRLSYIGTPVVAGERVFCPAANAEEPNETWVVAVNAKDGHILWKRVLATSAAFPAQNNPWDAVYPRLMPTPSLALAKGALIVLSNNGVVEALEPTDGRVLWARTYDRDEDNNQGGMRRIRVNGDDSQTKQLSRGYNPPLPIGDMVACIPVDSNHLTLYRLSDGEQLVRPRGRDKSDYVLGLLKGRIVLAGSDIVTYLEVTHDRRGRVGFDPLEGRITSKTDQVTGRGVVANGQVYVPCAKSIYAFRVDRSGNVRRRTILRWHTSDVEDAKDPEKEREKQAKMMAGDLVIGGERFFSIGAKNAYTYMEEE